MFEQFIAFFFCLSLQDDDELKRQKRPFLSQFFSPIFLKVV